MGAAERAIIFQLGEEIGVFSEWSTGEGCVNEDRHWSGKIASVISGILKFTGINGEAFILGENFFGALEIALYAADSGPGIVIGSGAEKDSSIAIPIASLIGDDEAHLLYDVVFSDRVSEERCGRQDRVGFEMKLRTVRIRVLNLILEFFEGSDQAFPTCLLIISIVTGDQWVVFLLCGDDVDEKLAQ